MVICFLAVQPHGNSSVVVHMITSKKLLYILLPLAFSNVVLMIWITAVEPAPVTAVFFPLSVGGCAFCWFLLPGRNTEFKLASPSIREIALIGFLIRLGAMLAFHVNLFGFGKFQTPDTLQYHQQGMAIADILRKNAFTLGTYDVILNQVVSNPHIGYPLFNGTVYAMFGDNVLLPKLFNVFFGVGLVVVTWKLALLLFNSKVATYVALATALHPTLIFWGALNLKEAMYSFLVMVIVLLAIRFVNRPNVTLGLSFFLIVIVTFLVRGNLTYFLLLGIIIFWIVSFLKAKQWKVLAVMALLFLAFILLVVPYIPAANAYFSKTLRGELFEKVLTRAQNYWDKHDIVRFGVRPELSLEGLTKMLFLGFGTMMVAPLPWSAEGIGLCKVPGAILRPIFYPLAFYGIFLCVRENWLKYFPLYYFPIVVIGGLILIAMGGMVRWQTPMLSFMIVLAVFSLSRFTTIRMYYLGYLSLLYLGYILLYYVETGHFIPVTLILTILGSTLVYIQNLRNSIDPNRSL